MIRSILPEWRTSRLQRRFAYVSGGMLTVISLVFLVVLVTVYRDRALEHHVEASQHMASLLEASLESAMLHRDIAGLEQVVAGLGAQAGISSVRIMAPDGDVRFASDPLMLGPGFKDPALDDAMTRREAISGLRTEAGEAVLRTLHPVANQTRCAGCHGPVAENPVNGLLVLDLDASDLWAELWQGVLLLGALGLSVMLAVQGGLWIAVRRLVLDRAVALDHTAQAFAAGDLSARAADAGPADEISRLGASFNQMGAQLQASLTALRAQQAFLQQVVDAIPDGVRVIGPDYRVLIVNRAFRAQQRIDPAEDITGRPCYSLSHGRDAPCVPTMVCCPVARLSQDEPTCRCSHTHIASDGVPVKVELQATRTEMMVDGVMVPCVVESIRDLERQSTISQEQRLAEMGMLAAGLAHEVFNPLSSVSLILERLEQEPLDLAAQEYLDLARAEIESCRQVTQSLLRLAAPGDSAAVPEPVGLSAVMHDTARLLTFEAEQSGCTIHVEAATDCVIAGRDSELRMLVFNLAQNAIHSMPDGGAVTLGCACDGDGVRLWVRDQGVGIAPEDREKVLMPFWTRRADGSQGRGLGLAICVGIVSGMGGTIAIDSTVGTGTTFTVDLPYQGKEAPSHAG